MDSQKNQIVIGGYLCTTWKKGETFPENILRAGTDVDGQAIYLGQVNHDDHKLPAKVVPVVERIYTSYDGKEHQKNDAFLLVDDGNFFWNFDKNGNVPETAVKFGSLKGGDVLYVGRTLHKLSETPGTIYPAKGVLRIPFAGGEVRFNEYYVLCHNKPATVPSEESAPKSKSEPEPEPEPESGCAHRFCDLLGVLINRIVSH